MSEAEEERIRRRQLEVFWRLHEGLPQQGPGSDASTRRALDLARPIARAPRMLDLGCGPGRQTLVLAGDPGGHVLALDLVAPFLEQLDARAVEAGLADRITTREGSMAELDPASFPDGAFDLIWSEGAIYNVGFDAGLANWKRLLAPGGRIAVTEAAWLVDDPPEPVRAFWSREYPAMRSREANRRAIEEGGYRLLGDFVLPEQDWWEGYYGSIEARLDALRDECGDEAGRAMVDAYDQELEVVRTGLHAFGYVFFVMERAG